MTDTWRDRAKLALKRKKLTQEVLAERLSMTQGGLGHWLTGRTQPTLDDINQIADEIGVSRIWLTHGVGFDDGPGKRLLDLIINKRLSREDLTPIADMADRLLAIRSTNVSIDRETNSNAQTNSIEQNNSGGTGHQYFRKAKKVVNKSKGDK